MSDSFDKLFKEYEKKAGKSKTEDKKVVVDTPKITKKKPSVDALFSQFEKNIEPVAVEKKSKNIQLTKQEINNAIIHTEEPEILEFKSKSIEKPPVKKSVPTEATKSFGKTIVKKEEAEMLFKSAPVVKYEGGNVPAIQEILTIDFIKGHICPTATDSEILMFIGLCKAQNLNPLLKEAYLFKSKALDKYGKPKPAIMHVGKEVYTKRAEIQPDFEGFEAGVIYKDNEGKIDRRQGSMLFIDEGEKLLGGWCRVFRKGKKPFYEEVSLKEYYKGGGVGGSWDTMPSTMIRKVALTHAFREAFPNVFAGLYDGAEMGDIPKEAVKVIEDE